MIQRDTDITNLRPNIPSVKVKENISENEYFQNTTLRPIIKLQNDIILYFFKNYIRSHKNVFYSLSTNKQLAYIDNALQKDNKLKNKLLGIVIGVFTTKELLVYLEKDSVLNKRILGIINTRLKDSLQVLNAPITEE